MLVEFLKGIKKRIKGDSGGRGGHGGFGRGGIGRGRGQKEDKEWIPVTKLGHRDVL